MMRETLVEGPDPLLGSQVAGRYTVMRKIARGGMGVVYLAVQDGLGRAVALKIIRKEAAADPVMQKRFEREARAVSQLGHPAIVTVHDFGRCEDGSLFLAMEFVDGEVLRDALKRKHRFTFPETLPIIENIASALARAHGAGIVHRDLKPENVMLPRQSASNTGAVHAKVLDFGLAKPHEPEQVDEHLTKEGGFVGTPGYASPEQAEGAPESPQQDLYALGVVWFELLSGEHPFSAPTPMRVVIRQLHEEPPSLPPSTVHGSLADVPPAAIDLVRRMMARRADDRPRSAHAVLEEIGRMRALLVAPSAAPLRAPSEHDSTPEAPTFDGTETKVTPSPVPAARRPWSSAIFVVVLTLFAGALGAAAIVVYSWKSPTVEASVDDAGVDSLASQAAPPSTTELAPRIEVVIERVPTFRALQGIRAALPASELKVYTSEQAVLMVDAPAAGPLADLLQGLAIHGDLPLVLEVKELDRARIVLMTVRPEDASALADAGAVLDGGAIMDAGDLDVVAPGGLAP